MPDTGPADPSPYRVPPAPELADLLAAMAENARAPKKPKKATPRGKAKVHSHRPQHNAHVVAARADLLRRRNAERLAALGPLRTQYDWHIVVFRHRRSLARAAKYIGKLRPAAPSTL